MFLGQVADAVFFLVAQTVNFRKVAQFEGFYVLGCQFSVAAVVRGGMFATFVVNDGDFDPVELSVCSQKINVQRV